MLATATPASAQTLLPAPDRIETEGIGSSLARPPDGGVLVVGQFSGLLGGPSRLRMARFAASGAVVQNLDLELEGSAVSAVAVDGNVAYLSGNFSRIDGQARGGLAAVDLANNSLSPWNPAPVGSLPTVIAAGGGVVYVGGAFVGSMIGGQMRLGLAAIDAATGLATAWDPGSAFGVRVGALAADGLYVGGAFSTVGTPAVTRNRIAKLDLATGAPLAWNAGISGAGSDEVRAIQIDGSSVYVGGTFSSIGATTRNLAAAFAASDAALLPFNPNVANSLGGGYVDDFETVGDGVFLCGRFSSVGGQPRVGGSEVAAGTGAVRAWNPNFSGSFLCNDFLVDGDGMIAAGSFNRVGAQARFGLVRLSLANAAPTDTYPSLLQPASGPMIDAQPDGRVLVADTIGLRAIAGVARNPIGRLLADGTLDPGFVPSLVGSVRAFVSDGNTVYVGGTNLSLTGAAPFSPLLAFDATTGAPALAPSVVSTLSGVTARVATLALNGDDLLIGGIFNQVEGVAATGLAAVRRSDRVVTATPLLAASGNPQMVLIAVGGGRVILHGAFSQVAGQQRLRNAALDATSYALLPLAPVAPNSIFAIVATSDRVYYGGQFSAFGSQGSPSSSPRNGLAAVDAVTGALLPWNPDLRITGGTNCADVGCLAAALALVGDTLYVGGGFDSVGGLPRRSLAAIATDTGLARPFDPDLSAGAFVFAMASNGDRLTAAGPFTSAAQARRIGIAAFDLAEKPLPDPVFANGFESPPP